MVGLHVRAIFEHVVYGAIVVWGNPDDLDRLAANERHHFNRMAKHLDGLDAEDGDARPWNLWDQCVRADALIGNRPAEPPNAMIDWYNRVYRGVSLISTHAGTMSTSRYAPMRPDGTFSIVFDPNEEALGLGQVYMGCRLTDVLAGWIREVCAPAS